MYAVAPECRQWFPQKAKYVEVLKFSDISATMQLIGAKFCMMDVELCPRRGFSPFGGVIFRGLQMGINTVFWTICLRYNVADFCINKIH